MSAEGACLMTNIEAREVITRRDYTVFLRLPWKIYQHDSYWVPPLLSDQRRTLNRKLNPFFKHAGYQAWIVFKSGLPTGRIIAYVDFEYNEYYNLKTGFIGFFECMDDQEAAGHLFDTAEKWLRQKGMQNIIGPMNFSIGNECGVQLNAYDTMPYLQMSHTPAYYTGLFEQSGFIKTHDLYAYRIVLEDILQHDIMTRLKKITDKILLNKDVSFRKVNMKNYLSELETINTIFNKALTQNWGFVPSSMEEVLFTADALKMIADPEIILFALYQGSVVGCSISIPDVNQALKHINGKLFPTGWLRFLVYKRKIDRVRVYLLGLLEDNRLRGLDAAFYYMSILKGAERGYREAELSWISEDNTAMIRIVEKIGATRYKTYRMYQKKIT